MKIWDRDRTILRRVVVLAILAICLTLTASATPLLEVIIPDKTSYFEFYSSNFDIAETSENSAVVVGWPRDIERLDNLGFSYVVIEEDIERFYANRLNDGLDEMGNYPTLDEIEEWRDEFVALYPDIVSGPDTVGYSLEGRPIWVIKISDNPDVDEDEPELFLNAAIHAREVIVPLISMDFAELLAENYGTINRITSIVDEREIFIMPVLNVDGYVYNEVHDPDGGGMRRKNTRAPDGVDLNRNFPFHWGLDDIGSSPDPYDATYRGSAPASEPETLVLMNFINSRNFVSVINYHSYSNLILIPWSYTTDPHPLRDIYLGIANEMNTTLGWEVGGSEILYLVNGDAGDWQSAGGLENGADYHTYGYVLEVGTRDDGFWPPLDRINTLVESQREPMLTLCELIDDVYQVLPPNIPVITTLPDSVGTLFRLNWSSVQEEHGNNAVEYDVIELSSPFSIDDVENTTTNLGWIQNDFSLSQSRSSSGTFSYYSGAVDQSIHTLISSFPYTVQDDDQISFMTWYDIEEDWDYAFVSVSSDNGETYTNISGTNTTNSDPNGNNPGNGITGSSNGDWIEATFSLEDYVGENIFIKISYVTDQMTLEEGIYFDDIYPTVGFEEHSMLVENHPDTFLVVNHEELTEATVYFFAVNAFDEEGDESGLSQLISTLIDPENTDVTQDDLVPSEFSISRIYPNPFNPTAALNVILPVSAELTVSVFNIVGQKVSSGQIGTLAAGSHRLDIDGSLWSAGLYFVRVEAVGKNGNHFNAVQKALLVK
jgi:Zinc carboxypeptidase/Immune inhibitor A-like, MAM domain/Secretion system C-terminal sorting domain